MRRALKAEGGRGQCLDRSVMEATRERRALALVDVDERVETVLRLRGVVRRRGEPMLSHDGCDGGTKRAGRGNPSRLT